MHTRGTVGAVCGLWAMAIVCGRLAASEVAPLFEAIRHDDQQAVTAAMRAGADVRSVDTAGITPLMYAAFYAGPEVIEQLAAQGADINTSGPSGLSALMWAASRTDNVGALLRRGADVHARASNGLTALAIAARFGNARAMQLLLSAGAQATSPEDRRNLLSASYVSTNPAVRDVLRRAGIVPTSGADLRGTVLNSMRDDLPTLTELLQLGVDPNEQVPLFTVALPTFFMAAREGQVSVMRAFVAKGADPAARGARGWTPLMLAASADRPSLDTVQYILDGGADVNARDDDGRTALDWALTRGETEVSAFLRKVGGRANAPVAARPAAIASPRAARDAVARAVAQLQPAGPAFSGRAKCISCHNQSVPGIAVALARNRGVRVDDSLTTHSVSTTEEAWRQRRDGVVMGDVVANGMASVPYGLLERAEAGRPATLDTDVMVRALASRQTPDGSWQSGNEIRPPLNGSAFVGTALAIRALRTFVPSGVRNEMESRVAHARAFLEASEPHDTQDRAFALLGLLWAGAPPDAIAKQKAALIALQRRDGGWGQMPSLEADAYATGQALYALRAAGMLPVADTYRKGADYLLRTQLEDGTWFVQTRAFGVQPYFETGFPHGRSQFISTTGTAWASIALAYTLD